MKKITPYIFIFLAIIILGFLIKSEIQDNYGTSTFIVQQGGTGRSSFNVGECLIGNGTSALTTGACGGGVASNSIDFDEIVPNPILDSDLVISGDYYIQNAHTSISDDLTIGDNITFSDILASISGTLTLDGIIDSNGTASSTFAGDLDIEGNINIGNNDLVVDESRGYVGIGTNTPTHPLNVIGSCDSGAIGPLRVAASATSGTIGTALTLSATALTGGLDFSFISTGPGALGGAGQFAVYGGGGGYVFRVGNRGQYLSTASANTSFTTFLGQITAMPYATNVKGIVARGYDGQTANLFEVQNYDGAVLYLITASGSVGINDTAPLYTLSVDGTASISDDFYVGNDMLFADVSDNTIYSSASWELSELFEGKHASISDDLVVTNAISGAGLASCSDDDSVKLLYDSTTKQFSCGTDQGGLGGMFGAINENGDCVGLEELTQRVETIEKDYITKREMIWYILAGMILTILINLGIKKK
jgi:hypothetical protein